jgi:hypothetical protein
MTIQLSDLKFPTGEFSHTMLAEFNGYDRKKVWTAYQAAIKAGVIVSTGNVKDSGKGKPAALWRLNDGVSVPLVPIQEVPRFHREVKPAVQVIVIDDVKLETEMAEVIAKKIKSVESLPDIKPATAPFEVEMNESTPLETIVEEIIPTVNTNEITTLKQVCPICKTPLRAQNDSTGIMVWCGVMDKSLCNTNENPFGHTTSRNVKDAYETLCEKYKFVK